MVHSFKVNDEYFVFDSESGSLHTADRLVFALLNDNKEILSQYSADETAEAQAEIEALKEKGLLFSTSQTSVGENYEAGIVKSLCLHLSHDCNLRCRYCFANQGDYHGKRENMPLNVALKAVDMLIAKSGAVKNLEMDFFGGEPLMNFDVLRQTVSYAKEQARKAGKIFKFTCTTNGLLLDREKSDYLNEEMDNVVLSIDGRKEVHDHMRPFRKGAGSYDLIVPKFQKLVQNRGTKDYYVRATFTKYNLDFTDDILAMRGLGFVQLSAEPVVTDPSMPYAINEEDLPRVFSEYDKLCDVMANRTEDKFNFFHFMVDLNAGPCAIKRLRGCGCGNDYVAVEPHGDIYPCHQFVGIEQWKMGNLYDGTFNDDIKTYFSKVHVYSKEGCRSCWAKFFCSGGCNANSFIYEGDVKKPYKIACEMQKKRLECAIALAADRAVKGHEAPSMSEAPASMG